MLYDLPEIELKSCKKYIFEGEVAYFNHFTANLYKKKNNRGANASPTSSISDNKFKICVIKLT